MSNAARLYTVSGRVQGVFFRDSTRREALSLGLTGHAINLPDGDVQVLACGDPRSLQRLEEWLHAGPPGARVDAVESSDVEYREVDGFSTG